MVNDTEIRELFKSRYEIDLMLQRSYENDILRLFEIRLY